MSMNRVLSFPQSHSCDGAAEFVSKRFCFSCLCAATFLSIIFGFMLGRRSSAHIQPMSATNLRFNKCMIPIVRATSLSHKSMDAHLWQAIKSDQSVFDYNNSSSSSGNEAYDEAKKLYDFFKDIKMDYISPVVEEKINVWLKDPNTTDLLEVIQNENQSVIQLSINRTSKYVMPEYFISKEVINIHTKGIPIYANYGAKQDFQKLDSCNLEVKNSVVIMRLGKLSAFTKVREAILRGAVGALLYVDPENDASVSGINYEEEINPVALERLQVIFKNSLNRADSSEYFPIEIISDIMAKHLLGAISALGRNMSELFKESTYSSTVCGFTNPNLYLRMYTTYVNIVYPAYNMIASIRGIEEPDRYVIISGDCQPMKGAENSFDRTKLMLKLAKILSDFKHRSGWQPRRSILFVNWGYSYEKRSVWMQNHKRTILERAVAQFHLDNFVLGTDYLCLKPSPVLNSLTKSIISAITNVNEDERKKGHLENVTDLRNNLRGKICIQSLNDDLLFGVPTVVLSRVNEQNPVINEKDVQYDENILMYIFISMVHRFVESDVLPIKVTEYTNVFFNYSIGNISQHFQTELNIEYNEKLFDILKQAVLRFATAIQVFEENVEHLNQASQLELRSINDKIMIGNRVIMSCLDICERTLLSDEFIYFEDNLISNYSFGAGIRETIDCLQYATESITDLY